MEKISAGKNAFIYPMPVTLLGTLVNGKPDFMTLGWVTRVNANPPMIGCGVAKHHYSTHGIMGNKTFSINTPTSAMLEKIDYCGLVSGKDSDKSALFDVFYGELNTAPMIRECPFSMECEVTDIIEKPTNNFYIAEIVASYTEEQYMTDGKPDIRKMHPVLLTMPDNRYWTIGEHAGDAWSAGKILMKP
jgi:flavin reductase (DIM6/NTAB) family NADH-FMN oxidoreductase RutF